MSNNISRMPASRGMIRFAKRGVKLALLLPATARRLREPGLFVLIYHRVGAGQGREMDMPVARFVRQMQELRASFDVVDLVEGISMVEAGPPSHDIVSITFDDAYKEVYATAWPVLRDLGLPATVFVPTGFVDGTSPVPIRDGAASKGTAPSPASWDELGSMASGGMVALGSHSVTHTDLDRLGPEEAGEEAESSKRVILERTGVAAEVFAYPRGVVAHEDVIARSYRYAVGAEGTKNLSGSLDHMNVTRTPVRDSDGMFFFRRRLEGIAPLEDRLYDKVARR